MLEFLGGLVAGGAIVYVYYAKIKAKVEEVKKEGDE